MILKRTKSLIDFAQDIDFDNIEKLLKVEDELAKRNEIVRINNKDLDKKGKRYLFYTSLPYTLSSKDKDIKDIWNSEVECNACARLKCEKKKSLPTGNIHANIFILGNFSRLENVFNKHSRNWSMGGEAELLRKSLLSQKLYFKSWFSNVIKCPTPFNRFPTEEEVDRCKKFVAKEVDFIEPEKVLILGKKLNNYRLKDGVEIYHADHPRKYLGYASKISLYSKHLEEVLKGGTNNNSKQKQ